MSILLLARAFTAAEVEALRAALAGALPNDEIVLWPDVADDGAVEHAVVWGHKRGELGRFENLTAIFSLGAGVETLVGDDTIAPDVAIIRLIDPNLASCMSEYILMRALHYHRHMHLYRHYQHERAWRQLPYVEPSRRCIGILGLGELGAAAAQALIGRGFCVAGWSRRPKSLDGVVCHDGREGFEQLVSRADVLVCLLPLTPETEGILCAATFALMPKGACLVNAARGGHLVDLDLLKALDGGGLAHATLDVFHDEPLDPGHAFWRHPKIALTPHISARTLPTDAPLIIAQNIRRMKAGNTPNGLVERTMGY